MYACVQQENGGMMNQIIITKGSGGYGGPLVIKLQIKKIK